MEEIKKKQGFNKFSKYTFFAVVSIFAIIGFILTGAFFAVKFRLTDDPGAVDFNDRYFQEIKDKYGKSTTTNSIDVDFEEARFYHNALILSKYYPKNAEFILKAYIQSRNIKEAIRMIKAVELNLKDNQSYWQEVNNFESFYDRSQAKPKNKSAFEWMNISEWSDFKIAVAKDKHLIDSVSMLTGVEPRLIVAVLVGEQIRLFNSNREAYKKWIGPLKILSVETQFSLGVTGIKVPTARTIERNLKDRESVFYLGEQYESLLDFKTKSIDQERFSRLTSYQNHFYSYLYAALNVKQINKQWERAGFPICERPEILATLYNVGFEVSVPKENPIVGGSRITIRNKTYTFGSIAYEFYYSGELFDLFPFTATKFTEPYVYIASN